MRSSSATSTSGVYPMAPFPANDHSLQPGAWVDKQYLDYGPLLAPLKGKQWVLEPHCVEVKNQEAKVNLFEVPGGWVVPVTFGPPRGNVTVTLRRVPGLKATLKAFAVYPGGGAHVPVALHRPVMRCVWWSGPGADVHWSRSKRAGDNESEELPDVHLLGRHGRRVDVRVRHRHHLRRERLVAVVFSSR